MARRTRGVGILVTIAFRALLGAASAAGPQPDPGADIIAAFKDDMAAQNAITVVTYGDSWTYGLSTAPFPFVERLAWDVHLLNPNATVENEGVGSWNSNEGLTGLAAVTAHTPDYCILNFGINDWGHGGGSNERTVAQYTADMGQIIDDLATAGCATILWISGPVKSTSGDDYGCGSPINDNSFTYKFIDYVNALKALAVTRDVPVIDVRQALIDRHNNVGSICDWFWNPIHLDQRGHNFMHLQFRAALLDGIGTLLHDDFIDTNGTGLDAHTPTPTDNGQAWVEHAGSWEIQGNAARKTATSGTHQVASIQTGAADAVIEVVVDRLSTGAQPAGAALRVTDNNNFWGVFINGDQLQLFERTAGTFTNRGQVSGLPSTGNDSWNLYMKLAGNDIDVVAIRNGSTRYTLSYSSATHATATRHGLWGLQTTHEFEGIRIDGPN